MSILLPQIAAARAGMDLGINVLEDELQAEKASSLGHQGRLVESSLAALRAFDAAPGDPEVRQALLHKAARAVWAFLVQRELCGLRDQKEVVRFYNIPGEVMVRLGAAEPRR